MGKPEKLPTILAVHATGPASIHLAWSDGIEGELSLTAVLADRRFVALRDPAEFDRVGVGEWGHSLVWPSGAELDADTLRHEMKAEVPNATTREAMAELSAGHGAKFASVDALMADLREGS